MSGCRNECLRRRSGDRHGQRCADVSSFMQIEKCPTFPKNRIAIAAIKRENVSNRRTWFSRVDATVRHWGKQKRLSRDTGEGERYTGQDHDVFVAAGVLVGRRPYIVAERRLEGSFDACAAEPHHQRDRGSLGRV